MQNWSFYQIDSLKFENNEEVKLNQSEITFNLLKRAIINAQQYKQFLQIIKNELQKIDSTLKLLKIQYNNALSDLNNLKGDCIINQNYQLYVIFNFFN